MIVFRWLGLRNSIFLIIALFLFIPPILDAVNGARKSKSNCRVSLVMDGDTIKMDCPDSGMESARIMGFDAPEKNARCVGEFMKSAQATWALRLMLWRARTIEIKPNGKDRYDRHLIELRANGRNVAPAMIDTGVARAYSGGRRGSWCE